MRWRRPASQLIAMQRAFGGPLSPDLYEQVSCPVQLIGAERGGEGRPKRLPPWPFGRDAVARLQARYQQLDVAWLPCGYMVPAEMPDGLAALIVEFVESTKARAR